MPALQQVVINITARGNTRQIREARRELLKLAAAGQIANTTQTSLQKQFDKIDRRARTLKRTMSGLGKMLSSMNKIALKLFTVGFAAGAAILPLVNALFATGRVLVNLYRSSMSLLAAAVAAVGAALAGAAAAMREYQAAVQAYNFKSSPALNNRLFEARASLRGLQGDAVLASFGMQALNQAFAAMSKTGQVTGASKNMLRGLADFAAAGGDPAKNLAAAAEFVALLQKSGKMDSKALAAAEQVGPTLVEALKKAREQGVTTFDELAKLIQSGQLSMLGGVEGQAGIVGGTVMGRFKAFMTEMQVMAADFGQSLLGPMKQTLNDIGNIIKKLFARVGPEMVAYGKGGLLKQLTGLIDALANFSVKLFREYLPGVNGMMGRFVGWWQKVLYWYNDFVDGLRSLLPLGSAVIEAFGKPFMAIFQTVGGWIQYVGQSIKENQEKYNRFGNALLKFIQKIQDIGKVFIDNFTDALPAVEKFLGFISTAVDMVMGLARAFGFVAEAIATISGAGGQGIGGFATIVSMMLLGGGLRSFSRNIRGGMPFMQALPYGLGRFGTGRGGGGPNAAGGYGAAQYGPAAPGAVPLTYQQVYANARSRGASVPGAAIIAQQQYGMQGPSGFTGWGRMFTGFGKGLRYGQNPFKAAYKGLSRHTQSGGIVPGARYAGFMRTMGPAAMLGIGSMFASPEAQKSMVPGAMVASLAPLLGKFGPLAAFGGMALAGIPAMMSARTAGGGAGMGALGGAGVGGAIGMLGGPVGMVIGSVLGAAVGAVVGYFKGKSNADKIVAKKAAGKYMNTVYKDLSKEFFKGDTSAIRETLAGMRANVARLSEIAALGEGKGRNSRKAIFSEQLNLGKITKAEYDALIAAPGTYRRELEKQSNLTDDVLMPMVDRFDETAKVASESLGITTEKLLEMANAAGVNLFDDTVKLTDTLKALGLAVNYTADQIKGAMRDIQIEGVSSLQQAIEVATSGEAMDEMTEALYQTITGGGTVGLQELGAYVGDFLNQLNLRNPNAFFRNLEFLQVLFGPGGGAFVQGQQLEGLEYAFAPIMAMLEKMIGDTTQTGREGIIDMITRQLLFAGIGVDRTQLTNMVNDLSASGLDRLIADLASGKLSPEELMRKEGLIKGDRGLNYRRQQALSGIGLGGLSFRDIELGEMTLEQKIAAFGEEGVAIMEGMNKVIEAAFTSKPDWMKNPPDWYTKESFMKLVDPDGDGSVGPDTSTPRGDTASSRLGRTLSRHNYFNSMFAGKRNITSAYRTNMLGSINSDHVTGKAYDLTGDNLGAYATMVNRMGGFAEFHGTGGARHLHVVPGETPAGDATAPYMSGPVSTMQTGSTSNTYNVVVNAAPGMDVNALASAVMDRIQKVERQNAERS